MTRPAPLFVKHARDAFVSQETVTAEWKALNFVAPPDLARAVDEYDRFVERIVRLGGEPTFLPRTTGVGLDSIYVRDASVACPDGVVVCRMGKPMRAGEPAAQEAFFRAAGVPILGTSEPPGMLEGGDVTWLGDRIAAVGRGYRTNDEGIRQLRARLADAVDDLIVVPLPHWRGSADVFHLMSVISPVDRDLAVVYSPLLPVPFRERLLDLGIALVEVPDEEFDTMGTNVLAVAPRRCLMLAGNPGTRRRLEEVGVEVLEYEGREISLKGGGGPTCLTRPLGRLQ
ncbi:MAG TPA: arginine deiminase family protein [Vicinamibacterales bacterium]